MKNITIVTGNSNGYDKSFSELGYEFKNKMSARKKAIEKLKIELEKL